MAVAAARENHPHANRDVTPTAAYPRPGPAAAPRSQASDRARPCPARHDLNATNMVGRVGTFIELRLTTGATRHVETGEGNAQTEIDRWAQREKTSWVETVEGIWVNPEHILEARLVELPGELG